MYNGKVPAPHSNVPLILNGNMGTKTFRGTYVTKSEHARQYNLAMAGWLVGWLDGGVRCCTEVPIVAVPNACVTAVYTSTVTTYELVFRLDVTVSCLA